LHAIIDREGRVMPGEVFGFDGRGRDGGCRHAVEGGDRRDRGRGPILEAEPAGEEAVEPRPLLGVERGGIGDDRECHASALGKGCSGPWAGGSDQTTTMSSAATERRVSMSTRRAKRTNDSS